MMRCVVFVVALALFAGCKGSAKSDAELIQGDWEATSGEEDGKAVPPEKLKERKVTVTATAIVFKDSKGSKAFEATYKLDASKKPKEIDIISTFDIPQLDDK